MARVLVTLLGLGLLALGAWLIYIWWPQVAIVLLGLLALGVTLLGLALTVFGLGEIAGALSRRSPGVEATPGSEEQPRG